MDEISGFHLHSGPHLRPKLKINKKKLDHTSFAEFWVGYPSNPSRYSFPFHIFSSVSVTIKIKGRIISSGPHLDEIVEPSDAQILPSTPVQKKIPFLQQRGAIQRVEFLLGLTRVKVCLVTNSPFSTMQVPDPVVLNTENQLPFLSSIRVCLICC